jgi:hypothetical protein
MSPTLENGKLEVFLPSSPRNQNQHRHHPLQQNQREPPKEAVAPTIDGFHL